MTDSESIGFRILRSLRRILRRTSQHSRDVARESGLTVPQMLCLRTIRDLSPSQEVTVAVIADSVQLSAATVSRILDRLDEAGLVIRERRSPDRRRVCHSLSQAGMRRLEELPAPLHEQFLKRLDSLDPVERLGLLKALERIVQLMDAEGIDASPVLTPEVEVSRSHDALTDQLSSESAE